MVVVFKLYREINLRHICPNGGHIALKGRTHDILVVVHQSIPEADGVNAHPALRVLHGIKYEPHLRCVCQYFLSGENRLVVAPELYDLSATAYHVKIHRVVLPEIDGDTLEIGSHDIEVDRKLENCFCQELVADNPGVKVCARLISPWEEKHRPVHLGEVFLEGSVDRIVTFFTENIFGVCVVRKIALLNGGFCLCFLVNKTEREHDVCSLPERGFHAFLVCL